MTVELDHIFICTEAGAPEADQLVASAWPKVAPMCTPARAQPAAASSSTMLCSSWCGSTMSKRREALPSLPRGCGSGGSTASPDTRLSAFAYTRRTRGARCPGDRRRCLPRRGSGARPTCRPGRASTLLPGWLQASHWCSLLRLAEGRMPSPRSAANRSSTPRGSSRSRGYASRSRGGSLSLVWCARYTRQALSRSRRATIIGQRSSSITLVGARAPTSGRYYRCAFAGKKREIEEH